MERIFATTGLALVFAALPASVSAQTQKKPQQPAVKSSQPAGKARASADKAAVAKRQAIDASRY